jgi:hypothetical protein
VYVFFGFPTETREEAEETVQFVIANNKTINSVGFGRFLLYKNSKIYKQYTDFGIEKIVEKKSPFSFIFDYETEKGMDTFQIDSLENQMKHIVHHECQSLAPYYEWLAMIPLIREEST